MSYFRSDNFMLHPSAMSGPKCYWCGGTHDLERSQYGLICSDCSKQCDHCGEYSVAEYFEGDYCEDCIGATVIDGQPDMLEVTT